MAGSSVYVNPRRKPANTIMSVEDDGVWTAGNSFTVKVRQYEVIYSQGSHDPDPPAWVEQWGYSLLGWGDLHQVTNKEVFTTAGEEAYALKDVPNSDGTNDDPYISQSGLITPTTWTKAERTHLYFNGPPDIVAGDIDWGEEMTYSIAIPADIDVGTYYLIYTGWYRFKVFGGDFTIATELVRYAYPITILGAGAGVSTSFPESRSPQYNPDVVWDETGGADGLGEWVDIDSGITSLGGGRYGKQIIAVSERGQIFFGGLS